MTTHERAEKMVAERLTFTVEHIGDEWHLHVKNTKRRVLASIAEIRLWQLAVRLQAELLGKESGESKEGQ